MWSLVGGERGYEDAGKAHTPQDLSPNRWEGRFRAGANRIRRRSAFFVFKYLARPSKRISAMNGEELGVWLVKWFPMLFDILTVFLLLAGCMLLWLNLRPRRWDVLRTPKEPSDQAAAAYHPKEVPAQSPELIAEYGASYLNAFPLEEPVNTDAAQTGSTTTANQNSYADRVASAMAKLRKPSAGLKGN